MNRKIKNVIIILAIIIIGGLSFLTMNTAKNSISSNQKMNGGGGASSEMGTPPAKPEGDNNTETAQGQNEKGTLPEMPSNGGQSTDNKGTPPDMSNRERQNNGNMQKTRGENQNAEISTIYYVAFAGEALIISILITYLIMSNFNKKTIKETLNKGGKIVTYAIIVIALTVGLTITQIYVTKNVLVSSSKEQTRNFDNNMQGPGGGTVTVNKGTYTTTGNGSPTIYSTADITVSDATLIAKA